MKTSTRAILLVLRSRSFGNWVIWEVGQLGSRSFVDPRDFHRRYLLFLLQLFDGRKVKSATDMFDLIIDHIRYSTNNGFIRSGQGRISIYSLENSEAQ